MNQLEFERKLVEMGCYFVRPSAFFPGSDKDATILNPEDFVKIFEKDGESVSKCIRKINDGVGRTSYFAVWRMGGGYMKCSYQTTSAEGSLVSKILGIFKR